MWKKHLDPYISVLEPSSSRILALALQKPGYQTSIHITVYLSTAGKDNDFMKELVNLQDTIDNVLEKYPNSLLFVRGDANACIPARKHNKRDDLFNFFADENKFSSIPINHKTYHHFMNNGLSDSSIDVIMGCNVSAEGLSATFCESLTKFMCGKTNPLVDSTHDILVSTLVLPVQPTQTVDTDNITAPKVNHIKHKIVWSEEGIVEYQNLLSKTLPSLQSDYIDIEEPEMASVLFQVTNHILNEAAKHTNKSVELGIPSKPRKPSIPSDITAALQTKGEALKHLNKVSANEATTHLKKRKPQLISRQLKLLIRILSENIMFLKKLNVIMICLLCSQNHPRTSSKLSKGLKLLNPLKLSL